MADSPNFSALHRAIVEQLLDRIQRGEATSAELEVARKLLLDNGISEVAKPKSKLADLATQLPFSDPTIQKPKGQTDGRISS